MITEDYVSFETAKLLKEKGFNENTEHKIWYVIKQFSTGCHWNSCTYKVGNTTREYDDDCCIPMPTLQMAMKWLREMHNIKVNVFYNNSNYAIEYFEPNTQTGVGKSVFIGDGYDAYEEACEAVIKYCLEHLI